MTKVHTVRLYTTWRAHSIRISIQQMQFSNTIVIYNSCFLQLHPRLVESVFHKHCSNAGVGVQRQSRSRTGHAPSHAPVHLQITTENSIDWILHLIKEQKCVLLQQDNWWWFHSPRSSQILSGRVWSTLQALEFPQLQLVARAW
jgi:hypothetical protein